MSVEDAIFDAIEEHADEGEGCGSPVGRVLEATLDETGVGLNRVCMDLRCLIVTGKIYQPNPTAVKPVHPDCDENEGVEKA